MFERQERVAIFLLLGVACAVITAHLVLGRSGNSHLRDRSPIVQQMANW